MEAVSSTAFMDIVLAARATLIVEETVIDLGGDVLSVRAAAHLADPRASIYARRGPS